MEHGYNEKIIASHLRAGAALATEANLVERTKSEISRLEIQLDRKKELLSLLERNPDTQRVLELMVGGGY